MTHEPWLRVRDLLLLPLLWLVAKLVWRSRHDVGRPKAAYVRERAEHHARVAPERS